MEDDLRREEGTPTISQSLQAAQKAKCNEAVGNFFYENGIPFNVAWTESYEELMECLQTAPPNYRGPDSEKLRTVLLRKARVECQRKLTSAGLWRTKAIDDKEDEEGKGSFAVSGRALCSDGWTSTTRRPLLNVILVTSRGAIFVKGIDTSGHTKSWQYQRDCLSEAIDEVGEDNVTALFVDGGVPKKTRHAIEEKYPSLFVLLCGAHSIDLLLEDFYKQEKWVQKVVDKAKTITKFIRMHHKTLAMFRELSHLELLRPGETRFGSNFICLERLLKVREALEDLVTSRGWRAWVKKQKKKAKRDAAKDVKAVIRSRTFWKNASLLVKISKPFVVAMKMADGDVPAMGKFYQCLADAIRALESCKELGEERRARLAALAHERWKYLEHPLHAFGHAVDPEHQLGDWHTDSEVDEAISHVLDRFYGENSDEAAHAERQLEQYRKREGRFAKPACIKNAELMSGWSWWAKYGGECPELQLVAMSVLSLVCGACSCERNWSSYDFIHTKRRNRLSASKCADLVYVYSNLRLLRRMKNKGGAECFYAWKDPDASKRARTWVPNNVRASKAILDSNHACEDSSEEGEDEEEEEEELDEELSSIVVVGTDEEDEEEEEEEEQMVTQMVGDESDSESRESSGYE